MEADEIGVVLARAAELHAKISDAIERSMKLELQGSGGKAGYVCLQNSAAGGADGVVGYGAVYDEARGGGAAVADGSAEARSLGAIRDALEVLEEQLESLQCLHQQQRNERDAALVDLEESRRILLKRLKDHRGREWEVVHEALAFAGEPVPERPDDLPLPPYPRPLADASPYAMEPRSPPFHVGPVPLRGNAAVKKLVMADAQAEEAGYSVVEESREQREEEGAASREGEKGGVVCLTRHMVRVLARVFGMSAKAIGVVTVIAVIGFSEAQKRKASGRRPNKHHIPNRPPPQAVPEEACPSGKVSVFQNGAYKCVVKERIELPFQREVRAPDVLFGRG